MYDIKLLKQAVTCVLCFDEEDQTRISLEVISLHSNKIIWFIVIMQLDLFSHGVQEQNINVGQTVQKSSYFITLAQS